MAIEAVVQNTVVGDLRADIPNEEQILSWVMAAVIAKNRNGELTVRIVDEAESAELNHRYRSKTGPTNVLSFPYDDVIGMEQALLGDIVICAPVLTREAEQQQKSLPAHWSHVVVHGVLHLQGYDHLNDIDAEEMENLERDILARLDFSDPYAV